MATSTNNTIQKLIDEVESIPLDDTSIETKLQIIAEKIATEQRRVKAVIQGVSVESVIPDPADAFRCEGCQ
jgi:hypothetical protein